MRITIQSASGQLSVLQPDLMPVWRFELIALKNSDDIGAGFRYPMPPSFGSMLAVGLHINGCGPGLEAIAHMGLSADSLEENQRRIVSAFDTLYNMETANPRQVDAAKERVPDLIKIAWNVRNWLRGDDSAGSVHEFEGWRLNLAR